MGTRTSNIGDLAVNHGHCEVGGGGVGQAVPAITLGKSPVSTPAPTSLVVTLTAPSLILTYQI